MSNIINSLNRRSLVEYVKDAVLHSDGTYRCACELHGGDNPTSFAIYTETNSFYCFGCNASGYGVISYVQHRDNCTYMQAVKTLCDDFGLTIGEDDDFNRHMDIVQRNELWAKGMQKNLSVIVDYLHKRGLSDETIERYQFGYSTKMKALSIPMRDEFGRYVAFIYRFFEEGHAKYKNSKNIDGLFVKGEMIYGLNEAVRNLRNTKTIMLCEGAFDAASAVQQGLCCMAYCGISITKAHTDKVTELLRPVTGGKVVLVPDNDGKASKFVLRAREIFKKYHPKTVVKVAIIPDGNKDLNDMLINGLDIATDCKYENIDLYCAKQIVKAEDDSEIQEKLILNYMKSVSNPVTRADIASYLAEQWGRDVSLIRELLSVKEDTVDEKLQDIVSVETAYNALAKMDEGECITTGFPNVDDAITMIKTDVTMIAAYSFMGKTSTLCQMILNWCIVQKLKVVFFSLEMPRQRVMQTLVAQIMGIPRHKALEFVHSHPETYQLITDKLSNYLYIVDRNDLSIDDIEDYLKLINTHYGTVDVIACDYFGYLRGTDDVEGQETTAKKMKAIAKRNNVLFVMLSQLNKASQNRENGKFVEPTMNNIKGAGGQGASADTILLLWKADADPMLSPIDRENNKNISFIKIGKARESKNGNTIFKMQYDPDTSKVSECIEENFLPQVP